MAYWVYENWQVRPPKAKIHFGYCSYCNNGQGTDKDKGPDNGKCHGGDHGYPTFAEAHAVAQATGQCVSCCKRCKPCGGHDT